MPGPTDKSIANKVQIAVGGILLGVALLWLAWGMGRLTWLGGLLVIAHRLYAYAAPAIALALIAYIVWAATHGAFANLKSREERSGSLVVDLDDRRISGVCSGIAQHFSVDVVFVRVVALGLFALLPVVLGLIYLVATIVMYPR